MKIVNAKKIMGAVALALLVGCFASCAQDNVKNYETADINGTVKVEGFAEAVERGIDFTATAKKGNGNYKVTLLSAVTDNGLNVGCSEISFKPNTATTNGTIFPFVTKDYVYTFKITDADDKEVIKFSIRATLKDSEGNYLSTACGIGNLKVTSVKPTGSTTTYSTTTSEGYKITANNPTVVAELKDSDGKVLPNAAALICDFRTDYIVNVDDGIDIPCSINNVAAANYPKTDDARFNNYYWKSLGFAGTIDRESTTADVSVAGIHTTSYGFVTLTDAQKAWLLLQGRKWTIKTRTFVRTQIDNNVWFEIESARQTSDEVAPAITTKAKVNQKYNLSVAGNNEGSLAYYNTALRNPLADTPFPLGSDSRYGKQGYTYNLINATRDSYNATSNVYTHKVYTENGLTATSNYRDYYTGYTISNERTAWTVQNMPGKQVSVNFNTGYSYATTGGYSYTTHGTTTVDYVVENLDAGSAWKEPELKPTVNNYFYKGTGTYWAKKTAGTGTWAGYWSYSNIAADGSDIYEHAWFSNTGDGSAYAKTVIVPTKVLLDRTYTGTYWTVTNSTVKSYWDDSVTVYLKGTQTYNK